MLQALRIQLKPTQFLTPEQQYHSPLRLHCPGPRLPVHYPDARDLRELGEDGLGVVVDASDDAVLQQVAVAFILL